MSIEVSFTVPGEAVGKGRPRISTRGGFARAYTPAKTVAYEKVVAECAAKAMADAGLELFNCPLAVIINIGKEPPKSWSGVKRVKAINGDVYPGKPDLDNICKGVLDAMNNVVYIDDALIVRLVVTKRYTDISCVDINVREYLK
jgi:Holliday junction resolvase RusA-like endonuclease